MALDWLSKVLPGTGRTRGLSGGKGGVVAIDGSNSFYNFRLQRHQTDVDPIEHPNVIWSTAAGGGLMAQIGDTGGDAVTNFTDVMLILSRENYARAATGETNWTERAMEQLRELFDDYCAREGLWMPHPERPLGLRMVCDGSPQMGGRVLGLADDEFVIGLVPNLYAGPLKGSEPVIGVFVSVPGAWEEYRRVGTLYSDQLLFTLGNHWLDNFSHPALRESALYHLQRDPDGSFYHLINPDLMDRYQVHTTKQDGDVVITLATREGDPLAYLALRVVDDNAAVARVRPGTLTGGRSRTILPEAPSERIFTFQERGALLQKVHFGGFMLGYDVFFGSRGELGTVVENPVATFQVRKKQVLLLANADGVKVDGHALKKGEAVPIQGDVVIEAGGKSLEYRDLRKVPSAGWPYVGEIRRPASSVYMIWGNTYTVGRSRDCRVVLPDESRNENIVWKPSVVDGAVIRSKRGDIPKARFYTDSIMVATQHARVDLMRGEPRVVCEANSCFAYVRRGDEIVSLFPVHRTDGIHEIPLRPGDEILVGNSLFHVSYSEEDDSFVEPSMQVPNLSKTLVDAIESVPEPLAASGESVVPTPSPARLTVSDLGQDSFLDEADFTSVAPVRLGTLTGSEPIPGRKVAGPEMAFEEDPDAAPTVVDWEKIPEEVSENIDHLPPPDFSPLMNEEPEGTMEVDLPEIEMATLEEAPMEEISEFEEMEEIDDFEAIETMEEIPVLGGTEELELDPTSELGAGALLDELEPRSTARVEVVDDDAAQFELGRDARIVQTGWVVNGTVRCGNHDHADLVLPENRIHADQTFEPVDYFELKVRGRRAKITLESDESRIEGMASGETDSLDSRIIEVIRRDDEGEEDFAVELDLIADPSLPDPRSRLLKRTGDEPLAEALFTHGLPLRQERVLRLGGVVLTCTWNGTSLRLDDYLATYFIDGGYVPFFVEAVGDRFRTAPEDGATVELHPGARLVIGRGLYELQVR